MRKPRAVAGVNVLEALEHAVWLGMRATPAIVMDDTLMFTDLPSRQALEREVRRCLVAEGSGE